ncbi:MAG: HAD-IA family hydrolase [Eubacterium sp.]|nr:HAD-IA family hydrolase [Eubacterium sp.]
MLLYENAFRKCYRWLVENRYVVEEEITTSRISQWLGMNAKDMWDAFQPDLAQKIKDIASKKIGDEMLKGISEGKAKWYSGAETVLTALREEGYRMVILSNCKITYKEMNWKQFQMNRWFEEFYDCESFAFAPKEEIIKEIEKTYPGPMIVIGDRESDLRGAKSINAKFIGCDYGYGSDEELAASDQRIHDITELLEAIRLCTEK